MDNVLFFPILVPVIAGLMALVIPDRVRGVKELITLAATAFNLVLATLLFSSRLAYSAPWAGADLDFSLRLYSFSAFIILASAAFAFLVTLYSSVFMSGRKLTNQFFGYLLIMLGFVNGAVLADNLIVMLFFWEGLLLTLFGMIAIGHKDAYKTAVKAFIIMGIADFCMVIGVGLIHHLAETLTISQISLPLTPLSSVAFICLVIGALAKVGAVPFHSWIPDAAGDAPLPFMAILPASLAQLTGVYFLSRITLDLFQLSPSSWLSTLIMIVGAATMIFALLMALAQNEFKRLLAWSAIGQVGYIVLGIGTAVPAGIVGGLFHTINLAIFGTCLFLTAGSVEKQAGTTDLAKLRGVGRSMPVTFACFLVAAAAAAGIPPFNGFFSKELVFEGALARGWIYYVAALIGSFLTAAALLKLGFAAFPGRRDKSRDVIKEAPVVMLIPMIITACFCIYNTLPFNGLFQPILGARLAGYNFSGFNVNIGLAFVAIVVLALAFLSHISGRLNPLYEKAGRWSFDPYDIGLKIIGGFALLAWHVDRGINWIYDVFSVKTVYTLSDGIRKLHVGSFSMYLLWSVAGLIAIFFYFVR